MNEEHLIPEPDETLNRTPAPPKGQRLRRRLRTLGEWSLYLIALLVLMQVVGWWRAPALPNQAPGFKLADLEGNTIALEDLAGQTVLLNFWAPWCMPCRAEIPAFSRYARSHPEVRVLGIAADGEPEELRAAAERLGIDYTVLVADEATRRAYNVSTLPTTVVVGPEGDVRYAHSGIMLDPQIAFAVSR